jgi:hypothetical protein
LRFGTAAEFGCAKDWFTLSAVQFTYRAGIPSQVKHIYICKFIFYGFTEPSRAIPVQPGTIADEADYTVVVAEAVGGIPECPYVDASAIAGWLSAASNFSVCQR